VVIDPNNPPLDIPSVTLTAGTLGLPEEQRFWKKTPGRRKYRELFIGKLRSRLLR
jgi:hypothetical protein